MCITLISACYLFCSSEKTFDKETILFDNGNATFDWLLLMSEQSIELTTTTILGGLLVNSRYSRRQSIERLADHD